MGKMSKKILAGLLAVVLVLGGILLYNLQMNKSFITTFYSVTVDKPVEDLRIVLLSDLHLHEYGEDNADLVRKIQNLAPDLIAVAGDMNIDTDTDYHVVLDLMHQLVDIAPVYYAPGNHEWGGRYAGGSDALFDDIQATGVHWLNGNYEDVEFKGRKLRIGGFFEWPRAQLERENSRAVADAMNGETNELDDVCTILICHCPEVLDTSLELYQFDLVLSGHAHGGQVRLPGIGGLFAPGQGLFPRYDGGLYRRGLARMVVSRGLGNSLFPLRVGNRPEVVVATLHPAPSVEGQ